MATDYQYITAMNDIVAQLVEINETLRELVELLRPEPLHVIDMMDGKEVQSSTWEISGG